MADINFKPQSGKDLVIEDAGSTDRLRITDGGSTILYEDGGSAALTINTDGNTVIADGNRIQTDEVRALDGAGLKLYDDGGTGIFIKDGGRHVAIGHTGPVTDFGADRTTLTLKGGSGDNYTVIEMYNDQTDSTSDNFGFITFGDYTASSENCRIAGQRDSGGNDSGKLLFYTKTSGGSLSTRLTIDDSGNFTGSSSADISDQRLKENIKDLTESLGKISQLRGIQYTWKKEANKDINVPYFGLLAQELESVFPELVWDHSVHDEEAVYWKKGDDLPDNVKIGDIKTPAVKYKSIHMTGLIPVLIEAVKELSAKVEALENA